MTQRVTKLKNGLTIVTEAMPGAAYAAIELSIRAGGRHGPEGVAAMLAQLAQRGAGGKNANQINEALEAAGAYVSGGAARQGTSFSVGPVVDRADLPTAIGILSDIVARPTLDQAEFETERAATLQGVRAAQDNPKSNLANLFNAAAFGGAATPLGRPIAGGEAALKAMTLDQLKAFHAQAWTGANIVISAAGNVDHDAFVAEVEKTLGSLPKGQKMASPAARYAGGDLRLDQPHNQIHIKVGLPGIAANDPDRYAFIVLLSALQGGMSAPLFQEIREKRGLVYNVRAALERYTDTGVFSVYGGLSPDRADEYLDTLGDLMRNINKYITDADFNRAKNQIKAQFAAAGETPDERASANASDLALRGKLGDDKAALARIEKVTRADLVRIAPRLLAGPVTVAAIGKTHKMPTTQQMATLLTAPPPAGKKKAAKPARPKIA